MVVVVDVDKVSFVAAIICIAICFIVISVALEIFEGNVNYVVFLH